jgi:hypothetical protein
MRLRRECSILIAVAVLALSGPSLAQPGPRAVVTTPHFAFFSDPAANLNDALIAAGRARRAKSQELFHTGPAKECFDRLPAADGRCRWPAQDASNRRWIEHAVALLKVHEPALGERLPQLYGTRWARVPYRVDVVDSVSQLGGNAQFFVPAGPHILISSSAPANQDRAALEVIFHEASHSLAGTVDEALKRAVRARGDAVRGDISHAVIFYLTGETVRRVLEQAGEPYTPYLDALKLFPDNVRDALAKTLSPYLSGQGTLVQAIDNLVQALSPAGR